MASSSLSKLNGDRVNALVTPDLPTLVCATKVNVALTGVTTPDGRTMADNDVYLAAGQTVAANCGVYIYQSGGAHTRHPAFAISAQFVAGLMNITGGSTYNGLVASYTGGANPTIGATALVFTISTSARTYDPFVGGSAGSDTTGTYTYPVGHYSKIVRRGCASGGSGGSGRKAAAASIGCGAGGGGGGAMFYSEVDYAQYIAAFGPTETYVVGGAVNGAAGQTTDSTDGVDGTAGRDTNVTNTTGVFILANGGNSGKKGTATTGTGGSGGNGQITGGAGASASVTGGTGNAAAAGAFNTVNAMFPTGGGAGGGVSAAGAAANGGLGGQQQAGLGSAFVGTAGVANGADAIQGVSIFGLTQGGPGGSGGGGGQTTSGTNGAPGSKYGAGGGGGGGARDGQTRSGNGGASAPGFYSIECV